MKANEAHHVPLRGLRLLMMRRGTIHAGLLESVLGISCSPSTSPWRVCAVTLDRYHDATLRYSTMVGAKVENECDGGGSKWA
jgi:hypothetical protein